MKTLGFMIILSLITFSCSKDNDCSSVIYTTNCFDSSLIDTTAFCTAQWDPVCGCNGITYSNSCFATINGITSYTSGECCQ